MIAVSRSCLSQGMFGAFKGVRAAYSVHAQDNLDITLAKAADQVLVID